MLRFIPGSPFKGGQLAPFFDRHGIKFTLVPTGKGVSIRRNVMKKYAYFICVGRGSACSGISTPS